MLPAQEQSRAVQRIAVSQHVQRSTLCGQHSVQCSSKVSWQKATDAYHVIQLDCKVHLAIPVSMLHIDRLLNVR